MQKVQVKDCVNYFIVIYQRFLTHRSFGSNFLTCKKTRIVPLTLLTRAPVPIHTYTVHDTYKVACKPNQAVSHLFFINKDYFYTFCLFSFHQFPWTPPHPLPLFLSFLCLFDGGWFPACILFSKILSRAYW